MKKNETRGDRRKGAGRPPSDDPRQPFPFRIRASLLAKARALGRERVERMIDRAKLHQDTK